MIKILFFIERLSGGGAETVLQNLVNTMDRSRYDITVQTLYPENAEAYLAPEIHYKYCYPSASKLNIMRMRAEAAANLTYRFHIKGGYDIEAAYLECGATKIMAGSDNKNALRLAWVHCDLMHRTDDPEGFAASVKKYYKNFDEVVCVSQGVHESFVRLLGDTAGAVVLYNVVREDEIRRKADLPLPKSLSRRRLTAVTVGRLEPPKNIMRALKTHKRLLDEGAEHDLWIVGEGAERPALEEYIRENRLAESVKLLGFCENPYCIMRAADLLMCSSDYEGFSTFITEGLILGKPVVTTDVSGMRELLGDSEYGLITPNGDEAFCDGVRRMLTEPGLQERYAGMARMRGKDFKRFELTRKTEAYLERALEEKRRSGQAAKKEESF